MIEKLPEQAVQLSAIDTATEGGNQALEEDVEIIKGGKVDGNDQLQDSPIRDVEGDQAVVKKFYTEFMKADGSADDKGVYLKAAGPLQHKFQQAESRILSM
jgi:hypothetical protein